MEASPELQALAEEYSRTLAQVEDARGVEKKAKKTVEKHARPAGKSRKLPKVHEVDEILRRADRTARLEQAQAALEAAEKSTEGARAKAEACWRKLVDAAKGRHLAQA